MCLHIIILNEVFSLVSYKAEGADANPERCRQYRPQRHKAGMQRRPCCEDVIQQKYKNMAVMPVGLSRHARLRPGISYITSAIPLP